MVYVLVLAAAIVGVFCLQIRSERRVKSSSWRNVKNEKAGVFNDERRKTGRQETNRVRNKAKRRLRQDIFHTSLSLRGVVNSGCMERIFTRCRLQNTNTTVRHR